MVALPEDILHDILVRLSAKSLLRFKCVSKEWFNLINDANFIKIHDKRTLEAPTFDDMTLMVPGYFNVFFYYDFHVPQPTQKGTLLYSNKWTVIVGCCNGIICLELKPGYMGLFDTLKERGYCRLIPFCSGGSRGYGFGYDNVSHVYKIVNFQASTSEVKVFSTGTGSWKTVAKGVPIHTNEFGAGVFTNNKLHWILVNITDRDINAHILTLDLHSYVFGTILLPSLPNNYSHPCLYSDLTVSSGLLYLYMPNCDEARNDIIAELWVMKEYGSVESWVKLYKFDSENFPYTKTEFSLISVKPQGNGLGQVLVANSTDDFPQPFWYDLEDNSTTRAIVPYIRCRHKPWVCVTSLISTAHFHAFAPLTPMSFDPSKDLGV